MSDDMQNLITSIQELTRENRKMNSLGNNFLRGIFLGVGSAVGASVFAAIVIGLIAKFFNTLKNFHM